MRIAYFALFVSLLFTSAVKLVADHSVKIPPSTNKRVADDSVARGRAVESLEPELPESQIPAFDADAPVELSLKQLLQRLQFGTRAERSAAAEDLCRRGWEIEERLRHISMIGDRDAAWYAEKVLVELYRQPRTFLYGGEASLEAALSRSAALHGIRFEVDAAAAAVLSRSTMQHAVRLSFTQLLGTAAAPGTLELSFNSDYGDIRKVLLNKTHSSAEGPRGAANEWLYVQPPWLAPPAGGKTPLFFTLVLDPTLRFSPDAAVELRGALVTTDGQRLELEPPVAPIPTEQAPAFCWLITVRKLVGAELALGDIAHIELHVEASTVGAPKELFFGDTPAGVRGANHPHVELQRGTTDFGENVHLVATLKSEEASGIDPKATQCFTAGGDPLVPVYGYVIVRPEIISVNAVLRPQPQLAWGKTCVFRSKQKLGSDLELRSRRKLGGGRRP